MAITIKKSLSLGSSWLTKNLIQDIDLDTFAADAVMEKLKSVLNVHSSRSLTRVVYFFTYKKVNGRKGISNLYVKRTSHQDFKKITSKEMKDSGAVPYEFKVFLEGIRAKKFKVTPKFFDNFKC